MYLYQTIMLIIIPVRIGTEKLSFQGSGRASSMAAAAAPMIKANKGSDSGKKLRPTALNNAVVKKLNDPNNVLLDEILGLFTFWPIRAAKVSPTITKVQVAIITGFLKSKAVTRHPRSR